MKRRIAAIIAAVVFAVGSLFALYAYADDSIKYSYDANTFTLTVSGKGRMTDYSQSNYSSRAWFEYADSTKRVVVSDGIEHIGAYSFARFSELESVSLPDSVTSIGEMAFGANDALREITIGAGVKQIGSFAFGFDSQLNVTNGFVAHCPQKSAAQRFCLENHIYFDTPLGNGNTARAEITENNEQAMWSFVAPADGTLTFYSSGGYDTFGLLYDADSYVYSTTYNNMKSSALVTNDDSGGGTNFKLSYHLTAGKRYYMSAKMRLSSAVNITITVGASFFCDSHSLRVSDFDGQLATLSCKHCTYSEQTEFIEHCNKAYPLLDLNNDGVVNAKDYAMLLHKKY